MDVPNMHKPQPIVEAKTNGLLPVKCIRTIHNIVPISSAKPSKIVAWYLSTGVFRVWNIYG